MASNKKSGIVSTPKDSGADKKPTAKVVSVIRYIGEVGTFVRAYSEAVHGKNFRALAKQFVEGRLMKSSAIIEEGVREYYRAGKYKIVDGDKSEGVKKVKKEKVEIDGADEELAPIK